MSPAGTIWGGNAKVTIRVKAQENPITPAPRAAVHGRGARNAPMPKKPAICVRTSYQVSRWRQSGRQAPAPAPRGWAVRPARAAINSAVAATGTAQTAKLAGQLPPTSGRTNGIVNAAGKASPTSRPFA